MEEQVVETLNEKVVEKLTPWGKAKSVLKKLVAAVIILKWIMEILKFIWKIGTVVADQMRRSLKLSITNRYDEDKAWVTMLWVKVWYFLFGLVAMYLLHYFTLLSTIDKWISSI